MSCGNNCPANAGNCQPNHTENNNSNNSNNNNNVSFEEAENSKQVVSLEVEDQTVEDKVSESEVVSIENSENTVGTKKNKLSNKFSRAILSCSLLAKPSTSSSTKDTSTLSSCGPSSCACNISPALPSCRIIEDNICQNQLNRIENSRDLECEKQELEVDNDPLLPGPSHPLPTENHNCDVPSTTSDTLCSQGESAILSSAPARTTNETKDNTNINTIASSVRKLLRGSCSRNSCIRKSVLSIEESLEKQHMDILVDDMGSSSETNEEEEYMEGLEDSLQECPIDQVNSEGYDQDIVMDINTPLTEKTIMKRKSEGNIDSRGHSPGKKPCTTAEITGLNGCTNFGDISQDSGIVEAEGEVEGGHNHKNIETLHTGTVKKRLGAKMIPPPDLDFWLTTFQSWTNTERLLALNQLIEVCEPTQVRHMMNVIEPQFQRDFISLLPKELALYVLSFLEPRDLLRAAQTCRYWRVLAEDNLLWREKCREAGIDDVREVLGRRRVRSSSNSGTTGCVGNITPCPWKAAYMRHHNIEMNWRCRPIRPPKVLKGHDDHVITCLQFSGNRIVSGSDDNTLKVWSATTGKCLRTLMGHTGGVWSSQMAGNIIISGSTDRTLKVWNADTGQCIHTLYGHTSTVRCMHLHGNKVVSGSRDATLRVWDIETGECLHVLVGHVAAVRCVQYNGKLVVSGAYDYMVKVWNPEREECLHTLQGHTNRVYSLQFDGIHVVSGSLDTSIRVWDVETGACKHTLMGHQSLTSGMELRNNILVSGNADSTVKVWDILTGQCLQTLAGPHKHQSAVTCLQFNNKFVITSSDDGTVKLWDLKTGEFIRNLVALESGGSGGVVWRIRASPTKLVCAVGSRNGTEETKLLVLDFDVDYK